MATDANLRGNMNPEMKRGQNENFDNRNRRNTKPNVKPKKKGMISNLLFAKGSMDIPFFVILMTIVTIGLVMLFSASYTYSYYNRGDSTQIFVRQLIFAIIGIVVMFLISRIRYEYFKLAAIIGVFVSSFSK